MNAQEVLTKAIDKAMDGGWNVIYKNNFNVVTPVSSLRIFVKLIELDHAETMDYEAVIFNHDFAKALWGENPWHLIIKPNWQFHLQNMVVAEDPIEYLAEHI